MHLSDLVARATALLGLSAPIARRQFEFPPDSEAYVDKETGLTFASYHTERDIIYRVALPDVFPEDGVYDTVLQVEAPINVGWAGWAWGGHMTYNPLAIAWLNGTNNIVLSPRIAYGYYSPPVYPDSKYEILKTGTWINATHWKLTAKCTGCSKWGDEDIGFTQLEPQYDATMAYAYANDPVDRPYDEASTFGVHDSLGHPVYDLKQGANADLAAKIASL